MTKKPKLSSGEEITAKLDIAIGKLIIKAIEEAHKRGLDERTMAVIVSSALSIHLGRSFSLTRKFIPSTTKSEAEEWNNYLLRVSTVARQTADKISEKGFEFGG